MKRKIKKNIPGGLRRVTSRLLTLEPLLLQQQLIYRLLSLIVVDQLSSVGRGNAGSGWRSSSQCDMMADVEIAFE